MPVQTKKNTRENPEVRLHAAPTVNDVDAARVVATRPWMPSALTSASDEPGRPTQARGEVRLVEGRYKAYGQDLSVETGRLIFTGGLITDPAVELRAERNVTFIMATHDDNIARHAARSVVVVDGQMAQS